jgi:hypothetical protein
MSGFFTSTIRSSLGWPSSSGKTACPDENLDVIVIDSGSDKLYHYSSNFTSTIKTSLSIAGTDSSPQGVSWDRFNVLWMGGTGDKAFYQSGRFSSTVKTSIGLSGIDSSTRDIGYNGVDTLWSGDSSNKLYKISGVFTTTIKSSLGSLDNTPRGVETKDYAARLQQTVGTGSNSVAFGNTATSNIKPASIGNSVAFANTGADVAIFANLGNSVAFDSTPTSNIKVENVGHSVTFTPTGVKVIEVSVASSFGTAVSNDDNFPIAAPANIVAFGGTIDNQKRDFPTNEILFDHIVGLRTSIRSASLGNSLQFFDGARNNIKVEVVEHSVLFDNTLARQMVYNPSIGNSIPLEHTARTTIEVSVGNSLLFGVEIAKAGDPNTLVAFTNTATATTNKLASNAVIFNNTVAPNIVANRSLAASILFGQLVDAKVSTLCDAIPLPTPSTISLAASGAATLVLKNPEFGNSESLDVTRVLNRSRGGTLHSFKASIWPEETNINFTVAVVNETKRLEILAFVKDSLGQLVTYIDQDGRSWEGIIENPEDVTIKEQSDCDNYLAEFNLAATLV